MAMPRPADNYLQPAGQAHHTGHHTGHRTGHNTGHRTSIAYLIFSCGELSPMLLSDTSTTRFQVDRSRRIVDLAQAKRLLG
jgi:hypothetical protein